MNLYFCLYSNEKYEKPRKALCNLAKSSNIFKGIFEYDRKWLESTEFYAENNDVLNPDSKGDGWCLWKPYVILTSLDKIKEGDILLYMDSTDTFSPRIKDFLNSHFQNNDLLFCLMGDSPNKDYTKRDAFYYMGCDSEKYWESKQLEAGIIGIKKTERTISIMKEYLGYCKDPRIIKDGVNTCGLDNFPAFVDHKYDQSVLTNLKTKYSIEPSKEVRYYVECNIWEALKFWDNTGYEFNRKINRIYSDVFERNPDLFLFWEKNYLKNLLKDNID